MSRLTPQEIREQEFKQSALGYSKEQVHEFLDQVADELEALIRESNEIHVENKEARITLKTYMNVEDKLQETLVLAQKTATDTLRNAQDEADNIIRKANTEKDALLFSAKEDLADLQDQIKKLISLKETIIFKLKNNLKSNIELIDTTFAKEEDLGNLLGDDALKDERIVDFSQSDLIVEDLENEEDTEPEITEDPTIEFEEPEDFTS